MADLQQYTFSFISDYVPLKKPCKKKKFRWIKNETIRLMKQRNVHGRNTDLTLARDIFKNIKHIRNTVKRMVEEDHCFYTKSILMSFRNKPKRFFGYVSQDRGYTTTKFRWHEDINRSRNHRTVV